MDVKTEDKHNNEQDSCKQPFNCLKDIQPFFQFYENGIKEVEKNKLSYLWEFLKNRTSGELVVGFAIFCLSGIAKEFIRNRNNGFDVFAIIGFIITILMIFVLAFVALSQAINFNHAKSTKKQKDEKAQPGVGRECSNKNGNASG